jgi:hypothetical protein
MKKSTIIATIDHVIHHDVMQAYPSIFTKEDVIKLLRDVEGVLVQESECGEPADTDESKPILLNDGQVNALTLHITDAICSHNDTQSLISDYDLSMSCREIEIDSITFDDGNIEDVIKEGINEWIENNTNN